jgi:hypothetical protein
MTFEEFFKKKKINLTTLQQAEGTLFAEFKDHFELMGEKSFDHTKKYWFNKLRHQFPAPPEVKAEKIIIENPLAEQPVTETLTEPIADKPKTGFTPRFKAGATASKPAEQPTIQASPEAEQPKAEPASTENTTAKPGFKPRFKAGITSAQKDDKKEPPAEPEKAEQAEVPAIDVANTQAEQPKAKNEKTAKVGFTPRFKAGITKPATPVTDTPAEQPSTEEEKPAEPMQPAKVGFTPRFKAGVTKVAPSVEAPTEQPNVEEGITNMPIEPQATEENSTLPSAEEKIDTEQQPKATTPPKIGFKPRFKPPQQ